MSIDVNDIDTDYDDVDYVLTSTKKQILPSLTQTPAMGLPPTPILPVRSRPTPATTKASTDHKTIICNPSDMTQTITSSDGSSMNKIYIDKEGVLSIMETKLIQILAPQMKQVMGSIECVRSELADVSYQISQTKTQIYGYIRKETAN